MRVVPFALAIAAASIGSIVHSQEVERGSGPYPAMFEARADLPNHVVYRPTDLAPARSDRLPIYVFGNGGCSADGTSSRNHLLEIASRGYLVIASGTIPRGTRPAAPAPPKPGAKLTTATETRLLTDAIDWAERENRRAGSPFEGRIATDKIAVSGWSCGGLQALNAAQDPRVTTSIIMNSGFFPEGTNPLSGVVSDKALLKTLHGSVLYVLGGPTDIAYPNGTDDYRRLENIPAAMVNIPVGHGGTYMQPHGGVGAEVVTAWLDWKGCRSAIHRPRMRPLQRSAANAGAEKLLTYASIRLCRHRSKSGHSIKGGHSLRPEVHSGFEFFAVTGRLNRFEHPPIVY
jgi:dienelactone hydrolase